MPDRIKNETQFIEQLFSTEKPVEIDKLKNELIQLYEKNYHGEIEQIIASKYVLKSEDKTEAAKDLYSSALEIFLMKAYEGKEIFRDLNYKAYILGIARNLFLEKTRKNKEVYVDSIPENNALDEELRMNSPFESELIQKNVEEQIINYYIDNNLQECLKILYYGWKKDYKNHQLAELLKLPDPSTKETSRRVSIIQQNCMKKAWRNISILEEVKKQYNIKRRKKHEWRKS